jgi:hypothetical protein
MASRLCCARAEAQSSDQEGMHGDIPISPYYDY